jgi:hypothetical protein
MNEKLEAFKYWQGSQYLHPFNCGGKNHPKDDESPELTPIESDRGREGMDAILYCDKCGYIQEVPLPQYQFVIDMYRNREEFEEGQRKISRYFYHDEKGNMHRKYYCRECKAGPFTDQDVRRKKFVIRGTAKTPVELCASCDRMKFNGLSGTL